MTTIEQIKVETIFDYFQYRYVGGVDLAEGESETVERVVCVKK